VVRLRSQRAIFIPNAIGIILYFVLRDPLMRVCQQCAVDLLSAMPAAPRRSEPARHAST
jgi:hypothetical protein